MIRVLMVDDDPDILELSAIFLERSGYIKVDGAESAACALKRLLGGTGPYDVVISDYAMPEMDGIAFLKAVRSQNPHLPFILFTGKSREEVVIEALNSGADYYMQKDGNPQVLFAELSHQIRQAADREKARKADLVQRDLALRLSGVTCLSEALKLCIDAAIEVSETDCGTVYLLDRASGTYVLFHSTGFSPEYLEAISERRRNPSTSLISRAVEPIYIGFEDKNLPLQKAREREGLRAMAVVPIHHEGEVIGYYSVGTHSSDQVPLWGRSGLETIAAITENAIFRLRAEDELGKSEEHLRAIFEAAENISFVITDVQHPDPIVLEFSPGAEKIFGYSRQEIVGKTVSRLYLPEDVPLFSEVHRMMREEKRGFSIPTTLVRRSGERFPAFFSAYPLFDENGRMRAVLGVSIDITDQRRMEEALQKSEEYYRIIFENSGTAMAIVEEDGLISRINSESQALFGRSPQEIEGKMRWDEFIAPEDRERLWELFRKGQRRLETPTDQYEADLIDRWGGRKRGLFRASIIPRSRQYIVSVVNITEQKRMEEALKKSEEMYRTLVEDQTELICRFLPDTTITFVNEAYCRYFGLDREDLLGQSFLFLIPEEERQKPLANMASLSSARPVETSVHRAIRGDDELRWLKWTNRAILDERGEMVEFQSTGRDITERKLAEDSLKETNKKLNLLASITRHDLLNTISSIEGYAQLLSEILPPDPAPQKWASTILDLTGSARHQITFTRDYQEMGAASPRWQRVDEAVERAASAPSLCEVRLRVETGSLEVLADPMMEKVFFNLMENSLRFGEKVSEIRISFLNLGERGIIVFEDDGCGVSSPHKEKIFERGFGRNSGYGLFLAREILGITGITIRETGIEGQGARFELEIPRDHYRIEGDLASG
ncbi:MAG TPA: PAS domain S-box protein [Methanothrix sp.]|nr:PAS domain S-box protein [Methanothrix sp.]